MHIKSRNFLSVLFMGLALIFAVNISAEPAKTATPAKKAEAKKETKVAKKGEAKPAKKMEKKAVKKSKDNMAAMASKMLSSKEIKWQKIGEGPLMLSVLWGDPSKGEHGRLVKIPGNMTLPDHSHTGAYHAILLSGTWAHSFKDGKIKKLDPGSYVYQAGKESHGDACASKEPCVVFAFQKVANDFIPTEAPKKPAAKKSEKKESDSKAKAKKAADKKPAEVKKEVKK